MRARRRHRDNFKQSKTDNQEHTAQMKACILNVYNSPEYASLRPHLPFTPSDLTLQQLSDTSFATSTEIQAIFVSHPKLQQYRMALLIVTVQTEPSPVPIFVSTYNKTEDDLLALIQKKTTWGEYARRARDRAVEMQAALQEADRQVVSGLHERGNCATAARCRGACHLGADAGNDQRRKSAGHHKL
jgi:hypothetical protein